MSEWSSHVFAHGALGQLAPGLWLVSGSLGKSPLPRNMVVYRLEDGGLLLHSAIALDDEGMAALEALGEPKILVVPNMMHRADAGVYKERYPQLQVCCPAGARAKAEQVVAVDMTDEELLVPLGIKCIAPLGSNAFEHVYELPLDDGVALCCSDSLFHLREHLPGFSGFIARYVTGSSGFFGVTRLGRLFMMGRGGLMKEWLFTQAARTDVRVVTVGHGEPVTEDVAGHLRAAADRL